MWVFLFFRLIVLATAAVLVPTVVRRRMGGRLGSYAAMTAGLAILIVGETLALLYSLFGAGAEGSGSPTSSLPTPAGGYLLILLGFLSLMHDLGKAHARSRLAAEEERLRAEQAGLEGALAAAVLNCATEYCIVACDGQGLINSYSEGGARLFGWTADEAVGKMNLAQFRPEGHAPGVSEIWGTVARQGYFEAEVPMRRKDGNTFPALLSVSPLKGPAGALLGYVSIIRDVTDQKEAQESLRRERDFSRGVLESGALFIVGISPADGRITLFNHGAERVSGYSRQEVIGREYAEVFLRPEDQARVRGKIEAARTGALASGGEAEHTILTKSGEPRVIAWSYTVSCDEQGRACHIAGFGHDVTEERQMRASLQKANAKLEEANAELARLAATDFLTGLLNRRQAAILFEHEIHRSRRSQKPLTVLLLDLDHFKAVNDSHGHEAGDAVLKYVAAQLRSRLRASDIIARYGGEEFLLVLPESDLEGAARVAEALRQRLQENPLKHNDLTIRLSTSIGIVCLEPGQEAGQEALIRMADEAMYCAKNLGGNRVVLWNRVREGQVEPSLAASDEVRSIQKLIDTLFARGDEIILDRVFRLVESLDARSPYSAGQSRHVAQYAVVIAQGMGLCAADIDVVQRSAMLQDLGRAAIAPEVLWKAGPLTKADWALIRQHPSVSVKIVSRLPFLKRETAIIRHHHERPDGRGYPDGLKDDAIPPESRILAVADALEAMTRARPHRPALPLSEALRQLRAGTPWQFDAAVVAAAEAAAAKASDWPLMQQPEPAAAAATAAS